MHSSRMRTGRSLTVCCSLLPWGGGGVLPGRGMSPWRGGSPWQGGSPYWRHPPPVNRMTNRCKNITLATTSLRPVKRYCGIIFYILEGVKRKTYSVLLTSSRKGIMGPSNPRPENIKCIWDIGHTAQCRFVIYLSAFKQIYLKNLHTSFLLLK